jgi:hypothetical protein
VYLGDLESPPRLTNIRRLTVEDKNAFPRAWSPDSKAVIFESDRNGKWDLFRQNIDERFAESIVTTRGDKNLPQLTPDGKWLLCASASEFDSGGWALMWVPIQGGEPKIVPIGKTALDEFRRALPGGKRCVLRTTKDLQYVFMNSTRFTAKAPSWREPPGLSQFWAIGLCLQTARWRQFRVMICAELRSALSRSNHPRPIPGPGSFDRRNFPIERPELGGGRPGLVCGDSHRLY